MNGEDARRHQLSRAELYDRVWTTPMRTLAKEFGISDVGLSKLCRRHQLPTPPRGYWVQKEHGKDQPRPPLPRLDDASETLIIEESPPRTPGSAEQVEIAVPRRLRNPHPLVERTVSSLRAAKADTDGRVTTHARDALPVTVGPRSIDRAARVLDALLKALKARGHEITITGHGVHRNIVAIVSSEEIGVAFGEKVAHEAREITPAERQRQEREWWFRPNLSRQFPSGRLFLRMDRCWGDGLRKQWMDGERQRIETCLGPFVAQLEVLAVRIKEQRREREEAERQWQALQKEREEKLRLLREEEERIKALYAEAEAWHRSQRLRAYVDAVRRAAIAERGAIDEESELDRWLVWATAQANRLDPLMQSTPSILDDGTDGSVDSPTIRRERLAI